MYVFSFSALGNKTECGVRYMTVPITEARKWRHMESTPSSISCHSWSKIQSKGIAPDPPRNVQASIPDTELRGVETLEGLEGRQQPHPLER